MTRTCIAVNCHNRQTPNSDISFHYIPKDCKRRTEWLVKIRRDKYIVKNQDSLCSLHFEDNCFNYGNKYKTLKNSAVPTKFDFPDHLMQPPAKIRRVLHREAPPEVLYDDFISTSAESWSSNDRILFCINHDHKYSMSFDSVELSAKYKELQHTVTTVSDKCQSLYVKLTRKKSQSINWKI